MATGCAICGLAIEGPRLLDPETGRAFHPTCFAPRVAHDAIVALIVALAAVLAPPVVVWAG